MKNKIKSYVVATIEILISILLGFLIWNLGIITFLGYILAFLGALKKKLFIKRKNMSLKLIIGTILIYLIGFLLPFIFERLISGDIFSGALMILLAIYIWFRGNKARKQGKL